MLGHWLLKIWGARQARCAQVEILESQHLVTSFRHTQGDWLLGVGPGKGHRNQSSYSRIHALATQPTFPKVLIPFGAEFSRTEYSSCRSVLSLSLSLSLSLCLSLCPSLCASRGGAIKEGKVHHSHERIKATWLCLTCVLRVSYVCLSFSRTHQGALGSSKQTRCKEKLRATRAAQRTWPSRGHPHSRHT